MLSRTLLVVFISLLAKDLTAEGAWADQEALEEMMQQKFLSYGFQCLPDNPLTPDDIIAFKQKRFPKGENAPCFMACVHRKLGILDDKGKYTYEEVLKLTKQALSKEEQRNLTIFLTSCDKVNEVKVSDGDKGCERAKLIYNCLIKRAPMNGFDVDI